MTALILVLLLLGAAAGAYGYALRQWRAARLAVKDERAGEARERLRFCLTLWPRSPEVHLLAARAARLSADLEGAEYHLKRCLKLQNGATEPVQLEFLLLRVQAGELDEVAPALFDLVDRKHPEAPLILETLARHYMHHLRYKEAYACLSGWIELAPDTARPYHWRGWVQERLNNPKQAREDYQRALERAPDLFAARLRLAEVLVDDHLPLEALPHLERLYAESPDRPEVQARLGQCRFEQGQMEEARRLMESAVKEMPNDPPLLLHLAKLDIHDGQWATAEARLRRVMELDATDTEAQYQLASVLQFQDRREEAAAVLRDYQKNRALLERFHQLVKDEAEHPSRKPDRPTEIGTILLRFGREPLAVYWLHEALNRDSSYAPAHRALAEHYERKGDREKAAAHRRQLGEAPSNPIPVAP